jgi:hypothetical protein
MNKSATTYCTKKEIITKERQERMGEKGKEECESLTLGQGTMTLSGSHRERPSTSLSFLCLR